MLHFAHYTYSMRELDHNNNNGGLLTLQQQNIQMLHHYFRYIASKVFCVFFPSVEELVVVTCLHKLASPTSGLACILQYFQSFQRSSVNTDFFYSVVLAKDMLLCFHVITLSCKGGLSVRKSFLAAPTIASKKSAVKKVCIGV